VHQLLNCLNCLQDSNSGVQPPPCLERWQLVLVHCQPGCAFKCECMQMQQLLLPAVLSQPAWLAGFAQQQCGRSLLPTSLDEFIALYAISDMSVLAAGDRKLHLMQALRRHVVAICSRFSALDASLLRQAAGVQCAATLLGSTAGQPLCFWPPSRPRQCGLVLHNLHLNHDITTLAKLAVVRAVPLTERLLHCEPAAVPLGHGSHLKGHLKGQLTAPTAIIFLKLFGRHKATRQAHWAALSTGIQLHKLALATGVISSGLGPVCRQ